ncbi:butyrophilin subfamily 3 member A2-like isoform X2 [Eleginops maclovinus]|uniref:butyrophilin subfamily 3 member A2-like isoform X2 n=1 Tax=Eleginops maclovinus TaxID=56733 RepID=UPI00307FE86B
MMLLHTDGKPLKTHLRTLSVLVLLLLLTHHCRGQSQLIGSRQPIVANLGSDIILPCYLEPAVNAAGKTLEWTRPDLNPRFVHVMRSGQELKEMKHKNFEGRTSIFTDELKNGNISLKLSNVQLSDQGKYRCFIPELSQQSFVHLVCASGPASPPVISLSGLDGQTGGVVLQCKSAGWSLEPEVLWLDAEGKLLSAGPPETVRGPDDLYTVSSRVTVEKRHSNSFTCRVQHHNTKHTTQTHFRISDYFFTLQSRSSSIIIGLAVSLAVCVLLMLAGSFLVLWKQRQNILNQNTTEEERGQLTTVQTVPTERGKNKGEEKSTQVSRQKFEEEQKKREEAEKEAEDLKKQLENETKELQQEKTRREGAERELKDLKKKTDSGMDIEVDQQREYIRLRNSSTEDKQLKYWDISLHIRETNKKYNLKNCC